LGHLAHSRLFGSIVLVLLTLAVLGACSRSPAPSVAHASALAAPAVHVESASLEWLPTTEFGVNAPLVLIGGESIQLAMQVEAVPEEDLVEILAPNGSDQPPMNG
jgi:PBP1b-binding outer membrane lipoprotein LpoB